ncbi:hypothetical protein MES4922_30436 [Mesorhizobium ventifaucium]|uniref:Uncharacterized protein n=1 Tax=Mesorhizobium ventifaucium TaxID=666020 RepID=A0ABM9DZF4_9HYPH|nr:hypothetical protein MES4922_30436 [Mesorhizobium ventifaucium]
MLAGRLLHERFRSAALGASIALAKSMYITELGQDLSRTLGQPLWRPVCRDNPILCRAPVTSEVECEKTPTPLPLWRG